MLRDVGAAGSSAKMVFSIGHVMHVLREEFESNCEDDLLN